MLDKRCKFCDLILTPEIRAAPRLSCKPCRSREVVEWVARNVDKRLAYANEYARRIGKVKQYPCETCSAPCYKKYAKAFCTDKCRFLSHVEIADNCWLWKSGKNRRGYGKTCFKGNNNSTAHRMAYELFTGSIPEGLGVLHRCDTPSCVKPEHLFTGTVQDNKRDQLDKDRGGRKLRNADILEIRKLYDYGDIGSQAIANIYNVTCSTISLIGKRRTWRHI